MKSPSATPPGAVKPDGRSDADDAAGSERPHGRRRLGLTAACWAVLAVATVAHLLLIFRFPLAPDETYYWDWSRHLDWGYYDQGPMVAWWIRASCLLFGDTPLGVRFGIVAASFGTQLFLALLARDLFGNRAALLSLIVASLTPLALAGSFIATYDPLVVLFWSAAMYFASRALFFESRRAWAWMGISIGLGLLSKHTMLFFVFCLFAFLAATPRQRGWLKRPEPYCALLLAAILFIPNLLWQSTHGWITFRHLFLLTGKGLDQPFLRRFGDFAGSQVFLMSPLLFFALVGAIVWAWKQSRGGAERTGYLFWMSAPVLLLFLAMTVKSKVQANWAVSGWLTPPILWAAQLASRRVGNQSKTGEESGFKGTLPLLGRPYPAAALAMCIAITMLLVVPEVRTLLHIPISIKWDQMNKLYGGEQLGVAADRELAAMQAEGGPLPIAVGAATYDSTSRLAFYMKSQPRTYCFFLGTRMNSYGLWQTDAAPKPGGNALVVDDDPPEDPSLPPFKAVFDRVVPVREPVRVYRRPLYREPVHVYYLYRCYGYRPNHPEEQPSGG